MLDNRQLVHPVHEWMTFLNEALEFAVDAGNQLVPGEQVTGIHRQLSGTQKESLDPVFPELGPLDESASSSFLTIREHLRLSTPSSFQSSLWRTPSGFD